jgi:hypothetical protein
MVILLNLLIHNHEFIFFCQVNTTCLCAGFFGWKSDASRFATFLGKYTNGNALEKPGNIRKKEKSKVCNTTLDSNFINKQ